MSYLDYLIYYPSIQIRLENLPADTLNSPMFIDIKNDPQLADYRFYLDNNPELIPGMVILYYEYINHERGENIDFANTITNTNDRNIILDLIKNYISNHMSTLAREVGEIRDPSNEELVEQKEQGIELQVRPVDAEPEEPPIDVNLLPVSARVISNEEKINDKYLPTANKIKVGGKTKKSINKYKKGKSKTNKTNKKNNKKTKTYKQVTKSKQKKTKNNRFKK